MTAVFQHLADFSRTEQTPMAASGVRCVLTQTTRHYAVAVTNEQRLHPTARGYNRVAELYEQARPDYPLQLLDHLDALHPITAKSRVLDLGAGTGKLSKLVAQRPCKLTAVEPSAQMLSALSRELPNVNALAGSAEAIPLPDSSVDFVVAGEAFHWFNALLAWQELLRVVAPGGAVFAAWLHRNVADWQQRLIEFLQPHVSTIPIADGLDNPSLKGFPADDFTAVEPWSIVYEQPYTIGRLRDMYESYSYISVLDEAERQSVLDSIERIVRNALGVTDEAEFPLPLQLQTWSTRRL
jgi:SAM-dependent methyltransferase